MPKRVYEPATAELINIANGKTLFTVSTADPDNNDGELGWHWDDTISADDNEYCNLHELGNWVKC